MNEGVSELNKVLTVEEQDNVLLEYLKSYKLDKISMDKFLNKILTDWEATEQYKLMVIGKKYFQNKNEILTKKRYRPTKSGGRVEDKRLNNSKESHSFLRKLIKQKSQYAFGKPFTIETEDDNYAELLNDNYLNKDFKRLLKKLGEEAVQCGIAWLQVYYDETGSLAFKRIPAEQCMPMWRDIDHTILDGMVRKYTEVVYRDNDTTEVKKVEFYVGPYVFKFSVDTTGEWQEDEDSGKRHFAVTLPKVTIPEDGGEEIVQKDETGNIIYEDIELSWDKVPFIPFKYNSDEMPLICFVKSLIDDYDKITSITTDIIVDIPDSIKVVRNYDGQDLGELAENIYAYRMVKVSDDGDLTTLENKLDIVPINSHLDRIRGDIFDEGQGVDTQNQETGDKSGVTLKYLYSDLDLDCQGLITEFKVGLEELKFFIDVDLQFQGAGDFFDTEADFIFNTDGIINEKEVIENIKNSADILPTEYLIKQHPYVDDATKVMDLLKKEKEEAKKEALEVFNSSFGGNKTPGQTNNPTTPVNSTTNGSN